MKTALLLWNSLCTFATVTIAMMYIQLRFFDMNFEEDTWWALSVMGGSVAAMVLNLLEIKNDINKRAK